MGFKIATLISCHVSLYILAGAASAFDGKKIKIKLWAVPEGEAGSKVECVQLTRWGSHPTFLCEVSTTPILLEKRKRKGGRCHVLPSGGVVHPDTGRAGEGRGDFTPLLTQGRSADIHNHHPQIVSWHRWLHITGDITPGHQNVNIPRLSHCLRSALQAPFPPPPQTWQRSKGNYH